MIRSFEESHRTPLNPFGGPPLELNSDFGALEGDALGLVERRYADRGLAPQLPTVAWRTSAPVYKGAQIGYATSGCWSPLLKRYLALAHLRSPHFAPGTDVELEVTVEHRRQRAKAVVRKLPFFDPERKRA